MSDPGNTERKPPQPDDDVYGVRDERPETYGLREAPARERRDPAPARRSAVPRPVLETPPAVRMLEDAEKPPAADVRWPLFSGVVTFPFYLTTLAPWILISIGLALAAEGVAFCFWLADQGMGTFAARFLMLPPLALGILTLSYASDAWLGVIQATSEGADKILDWPEGDWKEWFWTMPYTIGILAVLAAVGEAIRVVAGIESLVPLAVVPFVLYPVMLLSALEAGSPLTPYSPPIFRSLVTVWWAWLAVYVQSGVMLAVWLWLTIAMFPDHPYGTLAVSAPALAGVTLVYARLLGRLVWSAKRAAESIPEEDQ